MDAASKNGPLAPHVRPFVTRQRVRLIEDNPPASGNTFYQDWEDLPSKMLQCCDDAAAGLLSPHWRLCISPCRCVESIGEDHLSKRICINGGLERVYDLKNALMLW